tara:strand:- start:27004 stop:27792 length:789 start_codon:yes stop_codon:yes gene_type:complete
MATAKTKVKTVKVEREDKSYRLLKYAPLTFELKTGRDNNLVIFDEATDDTRAIKHCPNEKSIFVDEQSKLGVVKSIVFIHGVLHVGAKEVRTQEFLDSHPKNGSVFAVIDNQIEAQDMLDYEDTILDMKLLIRKKSKEEGGIEEIRVIVSALTSDISTASKMSPAELRYAAFELIESNPQRFLNDEGEISIFDDSSITRKAISQQAFASGVITLSPDAKQILWSDNKHAICSVPQGKGYTDFFASYLATDDGIEVMKELDKR